MSKKTRHSKRRSKDPHDTSPAVAIVKGLAVSAISAVSLITLLAIIISTTPDPGKLILPSALAALYISSFLGGLASSLSMDGDTPCGILCGIIYFIMILLLSLCIPGGASQKIGIGLSIALHTAMPIFSLLGAIAANNALRNRTRRKRRRNRN